VTHLIVKALKQVLRFTFNLTLLLLVTSVTFGQTTDSLSAASDTVTVYSDSLSVTQDSIESQLDSISVEADTITIEKDTVVQDTPQAVKNATETSTDSVTIKKRQGLEIFIDYGKLLTLPTDFESKIEFGIGYRINDRFVPQIQLGSATLNPAIAFENGTYISEGIYGTVGINYLARIDPTSYIYVGGQYGISMFDEEYFYAIGNPIWPDFTDGQTRDGLSASWVALVIGSEKEIGLKNVIVGGEFTLRVLLDYEEFEPVDTYAIPGYGRTADNTLPAINVYIKYLLSF